MSKKLIDNFNLRIKQPLDSRFTKENVDVDTPFQGMFKFQPSDKKYYSFIDNEYVDFFKENNDSLKNKTKINVKDYGAKGDGKTDDTNAINLAIANCGNNKALYFPSGIYLINATINISGDISIIGDGITTIIKANVILTNMLNITSNFINIREITLNGDNKVVNGINYNAPMDNNYSIFDSIRFHKFDNGFYNVSSQGFIINNCYFQDNGINIYSADDFRNCIISNCYMLSGNGIYLRKGAHNQPEGVRINNNTILPIPNSKVATPFGIKLDGGLGIIIEGNIIDQYYSRGILIQLDGNHMRFLNIINNWVGGSTEPNANPDGITTTGTQSNAEDITILGNTIASNKGFGIGVTSTCLNWDIAFNTFYDNKTVDLHLGNSINNRVIGNRFKSLSPSYASLAEYSNVVSSRIMENTFLNGAITTKSTLSVWKGNINVADYNVNNDIAIWNSYTPTIGATDGTITGVGNVSAKYCKIGKVVHFKANVSITTNGTATGRLKISLPTPSINTPSTSICIGREDGISGKAVQGIIGVNEVSITDFNNSYPCVDGSKILISGTYEVA